MVEASRGIGATAALVVCFACGGGGRDGDDSTPTSLTTLPGDGTAGDEGSGDGEVGDTIKLDSLQGSTGEACMEGGDCDDECEEIVHIPCDDGTSDFAAALGLNCPGEPMFTVTTVGNPLGMKVGTGFGSTGEWDPTEGSSIAIIGSGYVDELFMETPGGDNDGCPALCNDDFDQVVPLCSDPIKNNLNMFDPGATLPAPIRTNNVAGDCTTDAGLLGTGDCSNTIQGQFSQGMVAHDYTEIRITGQVPDYSSSLSYDFAFFSTEYPFYFGSQFNDMYVGWLESEQWTGNISFDEMGNPISLNAGFLDFRDDAGSLPEFAGTCMRQHAGTKWLTTTTPVTPGETITLVLAIFDLSDSILDSYALIDNITFNCEEQDGPSTVPQG